MALKPNYSAVPACTCKLCTLEFESLQSDQKIPLPPWAGPPGDLEGLQAHPHGQAARHHQATPYRQALAPHRVKPHHRGHWVDPAPQWEMAGADGMRNQRAQKKRRNDLGWPLEPMLSHEAGSKDKNERKRYSLWTWGKSCGRVRTKNCQAWVVHVWTKSSLSSRLSGNIHWVKLVPRFS